MSLEPEDFPLVTDKSRELLKEKQVIDYEAHRIEFVRWLKTVADSQTRTRPDSSTRRTPPRTNYRSTKGDRVESKVISDATASGYSLAASFGRKDAVLW